MNKFLKWVILILIAVVAFLFVYSYLNEGVFNKPLSPKKTVEFKVDNTKLEVFYNRPSKREREVFGALVPYNTIWRTGANEATTFKSNTPLKIGNDTLQPGKYTLWTIPNDKSWTVIFNSKMYDWGVDETNKPMREATYDAVQFETPVEQLQQSVEQFTIAFDNSTDQLFLTMAWDFTKIKVPLK